MIFGKRAALRAVQREDLPQLMAWRNRPELRKYFREYRELNLDLQERWFEHTVLGDKNTLMFSIVDRETETLLGCCGLCYIDWVNRHAELSLYIGHENSYIDADGYAEDACHILLSYGFEQLNLHKIWAEIYAFDSPKEQLLNKMGFHKDGILRDHCFYQGNWHHSTVWSLLQTDVGCDSQETHAYSVS